MRAKRLGTIFTTGEKPNLIVRKMLPDLFDYDKINISTPKGGKSFRPPRYFEKLFEVDQPLRSTELKEIKKRMAIESQKAKLTRTSLTGDELLEVEEAVQVNKLKSLRRSLHE